jgi:hypothetical protein
MRTMRRWRPVIEASFDRIDELLRALPEAPAHWIARAEELPQLQGALHWIAERGGTVGREHLVAALREAGLATDEDRQRMLRRLHERQDEKE